MATTQARTRCRERLERLSRSDMDCESLQLEAIACLRPVIGFDRWCWPFADPDTLLPLAGVAEHDYGPALPRALELEYSGKDFAAKDAIACRRPLAASLHVETDGDLARSLRWDEVLRQVGIGDVATAVCRDAYGCWGWLEVYRNTRDAQFDDDGLALLADVAGPLGAALRRKLRGILAESASDPANGADLDRTSDSGPFGLVILDDDLRPVSRSTDADAWLAKFAGAGLFAAWGMLPAVIYPAAAVARSGTPRRAQALVPGASGGWLRVEASRLDGSDTTHVAVIVRAATPAETNDLVCRTYGISARERQVVSLLLAGQDTRAMTRSLHISAHTIHDHLKSVFAKLDVHSRPELLAKLEGRAR